VRFQHDVAGLFTLLAPRHESEYITTLLALLGWISLLIVMPLTIKKAYTVSKWWLAAEILGLMILGLLVTPLLYFILYFCNLHTLKHWISMRDIGVYKHISKALWSASWPSVVCLIIGMVIIYKSSNINLSNVFIKTIFVGLGALTVPHWLLLEVFPKTSFFKFKIISIKHS
jgi:Brp/Blh family beta-carotene 15,15'-monooxygenase